MIWSKTRQTEEQCNVLKIMPDNHLKTQIDDSAVFCVNPDVPRPSIHVLGYLLFNSACFLKRFGLVLVVAFVVVVVVLSFKRDDIKLSLSYHRERDTTSNSVWNLAVYFFASYLSSTR